MKTVILLLLIQISCMKCNTIKYPYYCNDAKPYGQVDPNEKAEYAAYNEEPHTVDNNNDVNKETAISTAIEEPINKPLQDVEIEKYLKGIQKTEEYVINEPNNNDKSNSDINLHGDENNTFKTNQEEGNLPDKIEGKNVQVFLKPINNITDISSANINTSKINNIKSVNEIQDKEIETDISNIREIREHLLDHLLEYFINIIKEDEEYTETRKKNNKDKMKVENKLRNYYNPEHVDQMLPFYDTNEAFDDIVDETKIAKDNGVGSDGWRKTNSEIIVNTNDKDHSDVNNTTKIVIEDKVSGHSEDKSNGAVVDQENEKLQIIVKKLQLLKENSTRNHNNDLLNDKKENENTILRNNTEQIKDNNDMPTPLKGLDSITLNRRLTDMKLENQSPENKIPKNNETIPKLDNINNESKDYVLQTTESNRNVIPIPCRRQSNGDLVDFTKNITSEKESDPNDWNKILQSIDETPASDCNKSISLHVNINL